MTTSTLTIPAIGVPSTPGRGRPSCRADHTHIAAALGAYTQSRSGFAILPGPARHALLEIGDRLHGLWDALRPAEPASGGDPGPDGTSNWGLTASWRTGATSDSGVPSGPGPLPDADSAGRSASRSPRKRSPISSSA